MQTFISRLFRGLRAPPVSEPAPADRDEPLTIEDGSENATRRQLVQVLLRDVLRRSGISSEWIECRMLLVSSRTKGHGMYIRLILKHWDHRIMNYMPAFQAALQTDIERFEARASQWLHGISWQLEMGDSCPYTELPDKAFWTETAKNHAAAALAAETPAMARAAAAEAAPAAPLVSDDPTRDLERLFAIRDQELERLAAEGFTPVGYEKTQPSPL